MLVALATKVWPSWQAYTPYTQFSPSRFGGDWLQNHMSQPVWTYTVAPHNSFIIPMIKTTIKSLLHASITHGTWRIPNNKGLLFPGLGPMNPYGGKSIPFHGHSWTYYRHLYISIATAVSHMLFVVYGHPTSVNLIPCSAYIKIPMKMLWLFRSMNGLI